MDFQHSLRLVDINRRKEAKMALFDELFEIPKDNHNQKMFSITTGYVKENYNDKFQGRVKVEFFLAEEGKAVSEWIRVMTPYGGNGFGNFFLPEVGSEVVIGFHMGNIDKAIVLGCLWNEVDKIPESFVNKENAIKSILSKNGHKITLDETEGEEKIEVQTKGNISILMDDKEKQIKIQDDSSENAILIDGKNGEIIIKAKQKITFSSNENQMILLDGTSKKVEISAASVEANGNQTLTLKGQSTSIEGNMMDITSKGNLKVESTGIFQAKGSMVQIN